MLNLQILIVNYAYESRFRHPGDLLDHYLSLSDWAEALQNAGCRVTVLQRFWQNASFVRNEVHYRMVSDTFGQNLRLWQIPYNMHRIIWGLVNQLDDQNTSSVIHLNGLVYPLQTKSLRFGLAQRCGVVVQHHAELPRIGSRRKLQAWGLREVDGFFFTSENLASQWFKAGVIHRSQKIYPIPESSSNFRHRSRTSARQVSGLNGDPVIVWAGNLDENKDPRTILAGFDIILERHPGARLYMVYRNDKLLPEIEEYINTSSSLYQSVHLLGSVPHADMENFFNSADYFVQGSYREGSGFALLEALACGVIPIVTDIPAFRALTGGGQIGGLWPPGEPKAFASVFLKAHQQPIDVQSRHVREFFRSQLGFSVIAEKAVLAYRDIAASRVLL